jgi:hypothetical protein
MPWAKNNIVRLSFLILVVCSLSPANAQSPDNDLHELDNQQLDAFEREAANSNLTPLQIDGLETRIQNFSRKLAERSGEQDIFQRSLQLAATISAKKDSGSVQPVQPSLNTEPSAIRAGAIPRVENQTYSETSQVSSTEQLSQTQSVLMLVAAGLLDLLIVRRPFMAWYRRQVLFIRGANSVDILFKQILNRAVFEAFIFFLSFALVYVGGQHVKPMFHKW